MNPRMETAHAEAINVAAAAAPTIADRVEAKVMPYLQRSNRGAAPRDRNSLYQPGEDLEERGGYAFPLEHSISDVEGW